MVFQLEEMKTEEMKYLIDTKIQYNYYWLVTGTFHGSIVECESEGDARRAFHKYYNGESIIHIEKRDGFFNG